jgi:hypothetical protein
MTRAEILPSKLETAPLITAGNNPSATLCSRGNSLPPTIPFLFIFKKEEKNKS